VQPIAGAVGAEPAGVDRQDLDHGVIAAIRDAWLRHGVVVFRDQDLPPGRFLALAKRFGNIIEYPSIKGLEAYPEIIQVVKLEYEKDELWRALAL
jgi:taurine dioxygenase